MGRGQPPPPSVPAGNPNGIEEAHVTREMNEQPLKEFTVEGVSKMMYKIHSFKASNP